MAYLMMWWARFPPHKTEKDPPMPDSNTPPTPDHPDDKALESQLQKLKRLSDKATAAFDRSEYKLALGLCNKIIKKFGNSTIENIQVIVARAYFNKALIFRHMQQFDDEIDTYNACFNRFSSSNDPAIQEEVAGAYVNKAVALGNLGRTDESLSVYDAVIRNFGSSDNPGIQREVAKAYFGKARTFGGIGRINEEISGYDIVLDKFGSSSNIEVQGIAIRACINMGVALGSLGKHTEALSIYDYIINAFGLSPTSDIQEQVVVAYFNKAVTLGFLDRLDEEILANDDLVEKFMPSSSSVIQEYVAKAIANKGATLRKKGLLEDEIVSCNFIIESFGSSNNSNIQEVVASAYINKSIALGILDRPIEELDSYEDIIRKFDKSNVPDIQELVAKAYLYKGITYRQLSNNIDALNAFDTLIDKFSESKSPYIEYSIAKAYLHKGQIYSTNMDHSTALSAYNSVIGKFCASNSHYMQMVVTRSFELYIEIIIVRLRKEKNIQVALDKSCFDDIGKYFFHENSVPDEVRWIAHEIQKIQMQEIMEGSNKVDRDICVILHAALLCLLVHCKGFLKKLAKESENSEPRHYWHYSKIHLLRSILPNEKKEENSNFLRISSMERVNDPDEGLALREFCKARKGFLENAGENEGCQPCIRICDENSQTENQNGEEEVCACNDALYRLLENGIDDEIAMHMFALCFTDEGDRLDQWRMYGADGYGFSVGIPKVEFSGSLKHNHVRKSVFEIPESSMEGLKHSMSFDAIIGKENSECEDDNENTIPLSKPLKVLYDDKSKQEACRAIFKPLTIVMKLYNYLREIEEVEELEPPNRKRNFGMDKPEKSKPSQIFLAAAQGVMLELLYCFKSEDYKSEKEYRIFSFQNDISKAVMDDKNVPDGVAAPVFFRSEAKLFENPGYEIYIGPRVKLPGSFKLELEYRLSKQHPDWPEHVVIKKSNKHYR